MTHSHFYLLKLFKKTQSKYAFSVCFVFLCSLPSFAEDLCINVYYGNENIKSGHSYITIEKDNKIVHSYGFWPKRDQTSSLQIDSQGDRPLIKDSEDYQIYKRWYKSSEIIQKKYCQKINPSQIPLIKAAAIEYEQKNGEWTELKNNCAKFATYIYNRFTNDQIPSVMANAPRFIGLLIENAEKENAKSFKEILTKPTNPQKTDSDS